MSDDLRQIVLEAIASAAELPIAEVNDELDLVQLGLDSLDFSSILIDIEDAVNAEVPPEVLDQLAESREIIKVGDVMQLLSLWRPTEAAPRP